MRIISLRRLRREDDPINDQPKTSAPGLMAMKRHFDKNILLCVAGMTPQIVTETLYALTRNPDERIDEIRVITTPAGRDKVMTDLLDARRGQFFAFCRDYKIDPASVNFNERTITLLRLEDGRQLEDIRSASDNEHVANQICRIVYELRRNSQTRVHASVAGGRKTMGIYLTAAMQLFARSWDTLSHALVSEDFETLDDFYYIPPTPREIEVRDRQTGETRRLSTANAEIHLADIPFIRLRGVLSGWLADNDRGYGDLVKRAQSDLDLIEAAHDLKLDLRERSVRVADREAKLTEREFYVYFLFARFRRSAKKDEKADELFGWRAVNEIRADDLDAVFRAITASRENEMGLEECRSFPRYDFLANLAARLESSNPLDQEDARKMFSETRARINRKLEEAGVPSRFFLASRGERGLMRYGLPVPPERIISIS
jgi:CRISPR-associated protein (TIGR02584 family)